MCDILSQYTGLNSAAKACIEDIAQGDVRHYIRLFRRLVNSDDLNGFDNLGKEYYCIHALMMKPGESYEDDRSFIINVFDNGHSDEEGNALIRWRVLEYFLNNDSARIGNDFFEYYFGRLGLDLVRVDEVIHLWEMCGALEIHEDEFGKYCRITECATRYRSLIASLWYCIAIKTGMNIDVRYVLRGLKATREAAAYSIILPDDAEWVSDHGFLRFILDEEEREEWRILRYEPKAEQLEEKCRQVGPTSIHWWLSEAYYNQRERWMMARRTKRLRRARSAS